MTLVSLTKHSLDLQPITVSLENALKPDLTIASAGPFTWYLDGVATTEVHATVAPNSTTEVDRGDGVTSVAPNKGIRFTWTAMGRPGKTYVGKGTYVVTQYGASQPGGLTVVLRVSDGDENVK